MNSEETILFHKIADLVKDSYLPNKNESIPYIGLEHIDQQTLQLNSVGSSYNVTSNKYIFKKNDVLFGKLRPYFRKVYKAQFNGVCSTDIWVLRAKEGIDPDFLLYLAASEDFISTALRGSKGTHMPRADWSSVSRSSWPRIDIQIQKKISKTLGDLDRKIELNRKMNETLEQMGQALFRHYFVDNPESEGWEDGVLGDIIINFDSKRIPLSSQERSRRRGTYRYYGATSVMDYIDNFLFDGKYLLFAEDGTVINIDGSPVLQYVWGQFWVNNHAHVLQTKDPYSVEYLYLLLKTSNVQSLVNGAVQLKINQGALNSFKITIPPRNLVESFCMSLEPFFAIYRKNFEEIINLQILRDSLLPKLMSGQIIL